MNLLNLTPEKLKGMTKEEVHEGYKKIMGLMILQYTYDLGQVDIHSEDELQDFIIEWLEKNICPTPHKGWNPGDCGK